MANFTVGSRVEVTGKDVQGTVAFIGPTSFSQGKWVGIILDEPKGKNNGTIKGKQYFQCPDNYGMFVRQMQLTLIDESGNRIDMANSGSTSLTSLDDSTSSKLTPPGQRSRLSSSRLSLASSKSGSTPSRSKEDVRLSTGTLADSSLSDNSTPSEAKSANGQQDPPSLQKRASFVEQSKNSPSTPKTSKLTSKLVAPKVRSKFSSPKIQANTSSSSNVEPNSNSLDQQTGFVETLKPQFTPGQVMQPASGPASTQRPPPGPVIDPAEHEALKSQVKDLTEKLDTMRLKHKEKTQTLEAMKIQLDQAAEFKIKIIESQANLKKDIERLKKEKQDALEAKNEFSDLAETLEMATLDKEMAEEKAETLELELEQANERIEELTLDLEIMKAELEKITSGHNAEINNEDGAPVTNYQLKQLEQQNIRLHETLVRMRDVSAHEKHETQKLQKELEQRKAEINDLRKNTDKLTARCAELEEQVADLHEQVDAALGAEEMVEQLSLQKLVLEENVSKLQEEVFDLEALKDISDQLQEDSRELELQLRQDVDMANATIREVQKEKENALEMLADRELTIVKFRELVAKLKERCQELEHQLDRECNSKAAMSLSIPEMLDYKKIFIDSKALARAIDLELRRMEVEMLQQHVNLLQAFMPDSFMKGSGDHDAVLTLLLIPRLIWKSEILISQTRDKFPAIEITTNREALLKDHSANQFAARSRFCSYLYFLQAVLRQFLNGLNTCPPDLLMNIAGIFPELNLHEKTIDSYVELLRTNQLDENVNTDALEKCLNYFCAMHPAYLLRAGVNLHQSFLLSDYHKAFSAAIDSLRTDAAIINAVMQPESNPHDIELLCQHLMTSCEVMFTHLKPVRLLLSSSPGAEKTADFGLGEMFLQNTLSQAQTHAMKASKVIRDIARVSFSSIVITGAVDNEVGIDKNKMFEIATSCCDRVFDDTLQGPVAVIKNEINALAADIANLAQTIQETIHSSSNVAQAKSKSSIEITPPIMVRAKQTKEELGNTKVLRTKIEALDADIRELKMTLRAKQEEIGELSVRKELAEKKLANAVRDNEFNTQKLQRKLEEAQNQLKRKEKEFEETMDHLQSDIDNLEAEKGELKDKLKNYSKKAFIEGVAAKTVGGSLTSPVHSGGPVQVIESPLLLDEIDNLRRALDVVQMEKGQLEAQYCQKILDGMKPLIIPQKPTKTKLDELKIKAKNLRQELLIKSLPKVPDLSKRIIGVEPALDPAYQKHFRQKKEMKELQRKADALETEIQEEIIRQKAGSGIETDLKVFPTPEMTKAFKEMDPILIGEVVVPVPASDPDSGQTRKLFLDSNQFKCLQQKLLAIGT
ncbi:unnamed protein product [Bemisia tabaci]|uniref:Dynactin subunit 1 n=1 Tax=Bemisia tabaci TaxID=7038 RepID=A0A9P0ANC2_BEMTA|nr:unnamed protein product [Bemisia tabaci]